MRLKMICLALAGFTASIAHAECHWEWMCNGAGVCKQMPVCDSVHEVPPPNRPESRPPPTPPISMPPSTLPAMMGSLQCEHVMRQGKNGRWYWAEACFCADANKTRDPTAPFANIVRCD